MALKKKTGNRMKDILPAEMGDQRLCDRSDQRDI